ncbi:hypothetical protein D2T29_04050 [Sinirhodobacter populi]|uniref:Colicin transporter n=1 Tax=Paenirhodobacter populi TaxID=2306993 RepID=A0A443KMQ5_9RHOB|nr:hypothetical protein [Sinirhodobacter populi]RWR34079.1 hypothetical protein D2T29_04050 [Sinirhodobacter populi]
MTDIAEYERRIAFALERIGRQVGALQARAAGPAPAAAPGAPPPPSGLGEDADAAMLAAADEIHSLRAELEAERQANAQMSDRVRALREKQETTLSAMERRLVAAAQQAETAQAELDRLKRANLDLAQANRALIEAAGDAPQHLINSALQAEVETLRAARAIEAAELDQIIAALTPILSAHEKSGHAKQEADKDA